MRDFKCCLGDFLAFTLFLNWWLIQRFSSSPKEASNSVVIKIITPRLAPFHPQRLKCPPDTLPSTGAQTQFTTGSDDPYSTSQLFQRSRCYQDATFQQRWYSLYHPMGALVPESTSVVQKGAYVILLLYKDIRELCVTRRGGGVRLEVQRLVKGSF